jgi:hypothetical protein
MTRSARRRWTRELGGEIDGIALSGTGPILVHGYEEPAGGRWVDNAIPGKLSALDRGSGEVLWSSPCEVGYGRGFGAGFGREDDALVLGPSGNGHRAVRMSLKNGELLSVTDIPAFDESLVAADLAICASPRRVFALDSKTLAERWRHSGAGERYHHLARTEQRVFVVFSSDATKKQGLLVLDAASGESLGALLMPRQQVIHDLAADEQALVVLLSDVALALPRDELEKRAKTAPARVRGETPLALVAMAPDSTEGARPLWWEELHGEESEDIPEVAISAADGKLYLIRGALLQVRDLLTGRELAQWAVPGLDERVAFKVAQGAGLLAEETRASTFELPA